MHKQEQILQNKTAISYDRNAIVKILSKLKIYSHIFRNHAHKIAESYLFAKDHVFGDYTSCVNSLCYHYVVKTLLLWIRSGQKGAL